MKMMLRGIALLLLTLASGVSGQESCTLCPGNEPPAKADFNFFILNATCSEVAEMAPAFDEYDCSDLQTFGPFVCGCPGAEAGTCSGVCPDGSPPGTPDFVYDGATCADYDLFAKATSNDTECSFIQQNLGLICGCSGVNVSCSGLCADGMPVPNPELVLPFNGTTCGDLDFFAKISSNENECSDIQQAYGSTCGCAELCTVCPGGNVVPEESLSVALTLADGTTTTCGDFETSIMDLNATECSLDKYPISEECGCPAQNCTLCPNGDQPDILALIGIDPTLLFVCGFANAFVNGTQPDCADLTETGLPYVCACPDAALPSTAVGCTLCTDGTLSDPALALPSGTTCGGFNYLLAVENQTGCDLAQVSGDAWFCGCDGVEPPDDIDAYLNPIGNVTLGDDDFFSGNFTGNVTFGDDDQMNNFTNSTDRTDDIYATTTIFPTPSPVAVSSGGKGGKMMGMESKGKKTKKDKSEKHKMDKKLKKGERRLRSGDIPEASARQGGRVRGDSNF